MNRGEKHGIHKSKYRTSNNPTYYETWILGFISKRCPYVNNNLIIIQNIVIGLSVSIFYFIITKDFNLAITLSGLFAETGYNLIHNIEKLIKEGNNGKHSKEDSTRE